ncbi:hypothetical protein PGT21_020033 [Puccinia graminis f. sp. tritici]|uniref:Uncharacterized protein n=1 Tax=Puccinia graminis f. sp. tritici TaxID=56615 RepID=A0A5B0N445_PUCGR|nr:hypothetical protein PGT21_020033 [Puccinia graminis f. sp. tritici]KAA1124151.1 hypothetical protein PGTUg99_030340 [Puccinia graminis f. sp. tritici]
MHFSSAMKCLVVLLIQSEVVFGIQIFRCEGDKPIALCRRATSLDGNHNAQNYALMRAMQAGPTATCEQFTIQNFPVDNGSCCPRDFGVSPNYGDDTFVSIAAGDYDNACTTPATFVP